MRNPVNVKAAKDKWAREIRQKAILALGGRCQGQGYCPEDDPDKLFIVLLTKETKKWSQQVGYKRIIESEDRDKLAKVLCRTCREMVKFNEQWAKVNKKRRNQEAKGEWHWIAGQRVLKPLGYEESTIPEWRLK